MFQEIKISSCNIFLKESFSYISGNENREKLPYISGNKNPKETSYISGNNFPISKSKENPLLKLCLYFGKWNFLATSLKNYFLRRIPQSFSSLVFSGVFIFRHWFLPLFWGCFYCWLHFFHNFAGFCKVLRFCMVVPPVLRILESFFCSEAFLLYTPSSHLPQYRKCCGFEKAFFYFQLFFTTPSQHLAQFGFIKACLGLGSFFLKVVGPPPQFRKTDLAYHVQQKVITQLILLI